MIRKARLSDSAQIRSLVKKAWRQAHGSIEIDEPKLLKTTHRFMSSPQCAVFVSDVDGIKGLLACSVSPLDIAKGYCATDHVFYCRSGEGKKLITAYIEWAKGKGAVMINMNVSSGSKGAEKLIEKSGFRRAGGVYYHE